MKDIELDWFWYIWFELRFKELIVSNKLTNCNTIFFYEIKICCETSSLRLWRYTHYTITFLNSLGLFLRLLIFYMEYFIIWLRGLLIGFLWNLNKSNQSTFKIIFIRVIIFIIVNILVFICFLWAYFMS